MAIGLAVGPLKRGARLTDARATVPRVDARARDRVEDMSEPTNGDASTSAAASSATNATSANTKVLDVTETMADVSTRLIKAVRAPITRAAPTWKSMTVMKFTCPSDAREAQGRMRKNAREFGYNYFVVLLALCAWSALSHIFTVVLALGIFVGHHYVVRVRNASLDVGGKVIPAKTLGAATTAAAACAYAFIILPAFLGALTFGIAFVIAHAVMRVPDKADEDEGGEVPVIRDFKASFVESYRESGVSDFVPAPVSSAVRSVFGAGARK